MNFELVPLTLQQAAATATDCLVVIVPESFKPGRDGLSGLIREAIDSGDLEVAAGKLLTSWRAKGVAAGRLVLAGAGNGDPAGTRKAVAAALGAIRSTPVKRLTVIFAGPSAGEGLRAAVLAAAEAAYAYTLTKSKPEKSRLSHVTFGVADVAPLQVRFDQGVGLAAGVRTAREWANRPANHATPSMLADAAKEICKGGKHMQCEVLGPRQVAKLGMGAFMAVAQGSHEPLRFIEMRYNGGAKASPPVVLVGKGITFDTGGISIKPAAEMDEMKYDMSGAASVLGVFRALADLQPAINVVGLIPACENMPDGRAIKPGDVVTSMSGQTIEILNTDAEGRLVLCDALTYAERFQPRAVVDIATLTGACVIALGAVRSGLFTTSDDLAQTLSRAGESALDPCWRMPLDDDYAEGLKTHFADVANVAGRAAGSVTAAKFLQRFTTKYPWAHLDIAGTAWKGGAAKGATGRPVGLLVDFLLAMQGAGPESHKSSEEGGTSRSAGGKRKTRKSA